MLDMLQSPTMAVERTIKLLTNGSPKDPDAQWKAAIELGAITSSKDKSRAARALRKVLTSGRAHALIRAHAVESLGPPRIAKLNTSTHRVAYRFLQISAFLCGRSAWCYRGPQGRRAAASRIAP
jgi:hypothetical protein